MARGWRYRVGGVLGTAVLTAVAVTFINLPNIQQAFALVPFFGNPAPVILSNGDLFFAISTTLAVLFVAMWPLFKPRPRRLLDTILLTQKRVVLAMIGLAAMGYFKWSWALPRSTLMLSTSVLLLLLPAWMVAIRRQPSGQSRAVIVGDDPAVMEAILAVTDFPVIGVVSPPSGYEVDDSRPVATAELTDGGTVDAGDRLDGLANLGGLSRLDEVFVKHDVDTALLAFGETDRAEFFGALDACYDHGVTTLVHRDYADTVLTADGAGGDLVEVDLEPWDWQDYVVKRAFDVGFAVAGLVALAPVAAVTAIAIKLEDGGSILYGQKRTAEFGETFTVYKFRTMAPESENVTPGEESDCVTGIGQFLRRTHLDEIPQLWSILTGEMSVVGPRAAWTGEELLLEEEVSKWPQRWFVKPGLTGLAQINDATSEDPHEKLRYDIEYIRKQSFWFDVQIVVRQIWQIMADVTETLRGERKNL